MREQVSNVQPTARHNVRRPHSKVGKRGSGVGFDHHLHTAKRRKRSAMKELGTLAPEAAGAGVLPSAGPVISTSDEATVPRLGAIPSTKSGGAEVGAPLGASPGGTRQARMRVEGVDALFTMNGETIRHVDVTMGVSPLVGATLMGQLRDIGWTARVKPPREGRQTEDRDAGQRQNGNGRGRKRMGDGHV